MRERVWNPSSACLSSGWLWWTPALHYDYVWSVNHRCEDLPGPLGLRDLLRANRISCLHHYCQMGQWQKKWQRVFQIFFSVSSTLSPPLPLYSLSPPWITSPLLLSNVLLCISSSFQLIHPFLVLFPFFAIPCTFLLRLLHFLFFLLCEVWCVNMTVMNSCCCSCRRWSSWGRFIRRRQCTRSRSVQAAASVLSL